MLELGGYGVQNKEITPKMNQKRTITRPTVAMGDSKTSEKLPQIRLQREGDGDASIVCGATVMAVLHSSTDAKARIG
jgi:hypothetical protein